MFTVWSSVKPSRPQGPFSTPMPDHLAPPNGRVGHDREVLVHPRSAALELARHFRGALRIRGPHRAREAVHRGVRALDGVVDVAIGEDRQRGAELLLVDEARVFGEPRHERRRDEVAGARERRAARHAAAAVLLRVRDQLVHALELHLVVDRSELRVGFEAVADLRRGWRASPARPRSAATASRARRAA